MQPTANDNGTQDRGTINVYRKTMLECREVAVVKSDQRFYSRIPPFHPSTKYPEFEYLPVSPAENPGFELARQALRRLGLDKDHYGTRQWNPLGELIRPGDKVVIKPNLVFHRNRSGGECLNEPRQQECLVTHGSILRVVIDYAAKALDFRGQILVTDCPIQGADWRRLMELVSAAELTKYVNDAYPGITFGFRDYRLTIAEKRNGRMIRNNIPNNDPELYREVDLREESLLTPLIREGAVFGVAEYPRHRMEYAHSLESNKYLIPKEILDADVLINLPKLKTHKKSGITGSLKNLVGINGHKDYLPHFRYGGPEDHGDEYPETDFLSRIMWFFQHQNWEQESGVIKAFYHVIQKIFRKLRTVTGGKDLDVFGRGSWHGNDTLWRMILDINRALFYYDPLKCNVMRRLSGKQYFVLVDGIIGGDGEGPLTCRFRESGIIIAGSNPAAIDATASAMMGFDPSRIRHIRNAFDIKEMALTTFSMEEIEIRSNLDIQTLRDIFVKHAFETFLPSRGFQDAIEYTDSFQQGDVR